MAQEPRGVIDSLRDLREPGQPDPLAELIELFLRDARPRLADMHAAAAAGNWSKVGAGAHALKGSASNLGAQRLSNLCFSLERLAGDGKLAEAADLFGQVTEEYGRVCFVLEHERKKPIKSLESD